jgi:hypothetical protein
MSKRKGARSIKAIAPEILRQLNLGEIESANLVKALAIDFDLLLKSSAIEATSLPPCTTITLSSPG